MAFERYRRAKEQIGLDLIPVMNLLVVLIPFLLMGASFFHIGIIPVSLPSHVSADPPPEPPEEITLNLVIKEEQLELTASSTEVDEARLEQLARSFAYEPGNLRLERVTAYLKELKADFPTSDTMIVLPHPELDYETLVQILDSTREYPTDRRDSEGEPVMEPLFPVVTFSRFITENAFAAAEEETSP